MLKFAPFEGFIFEQQANGRTMVKNTGVHVNYVQKGSKKHLL